MNTENFEAFNRIALFALVQLFESFPEPMDLDARRIGIDAKPGRTKMKPRKNSGPI